MRDRQSESIELVFKANVEELDQANAKIKAQEAQIESLKQQVEDLNKEYSSSNAAKYKQQLEELQSTARRAGDAFMSMLKSLNLAYRDTDGSTKVISDYVKELYNQVFAGQKTYHAALTELMIQMPEAFNRVKESSGTAFNNETLIEFTTRLNEMFGVLTQVHELLQKIDTEGVNAKPVDGAVNAGVDIAGAMAEIKAEAQGMDAELKGSYEAIYKLVEALTQYANLPAANLNAVSLAFRGIGDIGNGSFSGKKIDAIIDLATRLQGLSGTGASYNFSITGLNDISVNTNTLKALGEFFKSIDGIKANGINAISDANFSGLEALGKVSVRSTSLENLANYLPKLCGKDISPAKLIKLNDLDLSKLNGLSIREASLKNLATYLPQIAKANMDRLSKLQGFNFDNFNNIHINRGSIQTIHDLVAAMTSFVQTAQKVSNTGGANVEYMLGNIARVVRQGRELLNNNTEAVGSASYSKLTSSISNLEDVLKICGTDASRLNDALDQIGISAPDQINIATSAMSTLREELQGAGKEGTITLDKLRKLSTSLSKTLFSAANTNSDLMNTQEYKAAEQTLAKIEAALILVRDRGYGLRDALRTVGLDTSNAAAQAEHALAELNHQITRTKESMKGNTVEFRIQTGDLEQKLHAVTDAFDNLRNRDVISSTLQGNIDRLNELFNIISNPTSVEKQNEALDEFNRLLGVTKTQVQSLAAAERQAANEKRQTEDLIRNLTNLQEKLNLMQEKFKDSQKTDSNPQWKQLQDDMKAVEDILNRLSNKNISPADIEKAKRDFKDVSADVSNLDKRLGKGKSTITDYFKQFLTGSRIIMSIIRQIRQMINTAIELDKEMTQLQIVTKASNAEMDRFGDTILQVSNRIAISAKDLISATTTFARLGYTMEESTKLAEITGMLQNVGDIEASAAQNAITAIVKAFNVDVNDIEQVADKLVTVGKYIAQICGNTY